MNARSFILGITLAAIPLGSADPDPHAMLDPLAAEAAGMTSGAPALAALTVTDPSGQGSWGPVIPWAPHIPVTAATLPDGRLLTFASNQRTTFPSASEFTYSAVWDPKTGLFTESNNARHDMFCGGAVMLPDGRVVVSGGRNTSALSSIFDYRTGNWNALQNMNDPRWYNSSVAMPDSTVFTVSGSGGSNTAELWNASTGWRRLTGIGWGAVTSQPGYVNFQHPFVMLAPNGKLSHFGPTDAMNWITTGGSGTLTPAGRNVPGAHYPKEGVFAMYDKGRILVAGGGANVDNNPNDSSTGISTNAAYTVDVNGITPVVAPAAAMAYPRQFANSVVLPTGEVLVIGGNSSGLKFHDAGSIMVPELWNPRTGAWRSLSEMSVPRNYHSLALLLPDGRVWSGGGGLGGADHRDAQIFTPPALFAENGSLAERPTITAGPAVIGPGTRFTIGATPGLAKFAFIRMSSQTHSVNTDLRYLTLTFSETSPGSYELTGNANFNVMLPGYWMLFALDSNSVHSIAKIIRVSISSDVTIGSPGDQQAVRDFPVRLPVSVSALPSVTIVHSATGLPAGLSIDPASGIISGTPTATGNSATVVTATPSTGSPVSAAFNWKVILPNLGTGKIMREWWLDIAGQALIDLTASPLYPANPTNRDFLESFEAPTNWADDFGQRIRGYIHPEVTGGYRFWIASDNESRLLLSTDENPANAIEIATNPSFAGIREWAKFPQQASVLINLEAGKRYYIEALMKDGSGPDNLAVGWTRPGNQTIEVIAGQFLSPFGPAPSPLAEWRFDEPVWNGTGGEVKDSAGLLTNANGTAAGEALTTSEGPVFDGNPGTGRSAALLGDGGHIRVPFNTAFNSGDFTISAWVRPTTATAPDWRSVIVSRETVAGRITGYGLYASPEGKWTFLTGSNWTALTGPPLTAGQWSHVSASFRTTGVDGSARYGIRRIFINGIQVAEDGGSYVPSATANLLIGASETEGAIGHFMSGNIDEARYHQETLGTIDLMNVMSLRHDLNFVPVVVSPGNLASARDSIVSQPIQASDPAGGNLFFSATGLPNGLAISTNSGIISGTPNVIGDFNVTVIATDGEGESAEASFVWSIVENLTVTAVQTPPLPSGGAVPLDATGSGGKNPRYSWNFGDGSPDSLFSTSAAISHVFPGPGRYLVTVTGTDDTGRIVTGSYHQAIHAPLTENRPASSGAIHYERRGTGNDRVWVVNPDNNSVAVLDAVTQARLAEIPVGAGPRCVSGAPNGRLWVTNSESSTISIIDPTTLSVIRTLAFARGAKPFGIAFSPTGDAAHVVLENAGKILQLDPVAGIQTAAADVGMNVRHLSVSADGSRIYVSRFITPRLTGEGTAAIVTAGQGGEVVVIHGPSYTVERTILLEHSEMPDTSISARGIPNYLAAAVISPDGLSAWVPSKQDNVKRGKLRDDRDLTHDMSVRAIASRLDLAGQVEDAAARVDFDNAGMPTAVVYDPWGIYAFVALEASRSVAVVDVWNRVEVMRFDAGRAPQGLVVSRDGRRLFVQNFMDRSVSVHSIGGLIDGGNMLPPPGVFVSTITNEKLPAQILTGKQLFHDAKDNRLAFQGYLSCASCHHDGEQDGRVWDFTGFGEGLRNTITLRGHGGTSQGPLHWTGNFNEIQDFENQIRSFAGGQGLISGGAPHPPLGTPNAGRSTDLDALAAYLQSLGSNGKSPHRESDGSLTAAARAGEAVFRAQDCASCHGGSGFTNSGAGSLSNIGTLKPSSGKRLGGNLTGLDIPTLRGLWNTAPYLHDGSAATLENAITSHQGVTIAGADLSNLVTYLKSVDDMPLSAPLPKTRFTGWAEATPGADGNLDSNADGDLYQDLFEYALGGLPDSGASPSADALVLEESAGNHSLLVKRPVGLTDADYEAWTSPDLATWSIAPPPSIENSAGGFETLRFANLQGRPGLGVDNGFVRLRVTVNGVSRNTLPLGWNGVTLGSSSRTVGVPFREIPVFSSMVKGVSGLRLAVNGTPQVGTGFRGFVEVITGNFAGHRFEAASAGPGAITTVASPRNTLGILPDLTNSRIVLCAHHTLGGVFNKTLFKGATNPAAADQIQFYANNGTSGQFELHYLLDARPGNPTHQWRAFLPGGGDQGGRVIGPGEGVLLKRPAGASVTRLPLRGQVRANPFAQPLNSGVNLTASPFPLALTPRSRGLLDPAAAFAASTNVNAADQFHLYQNNAFRVFYLLDHPTLADPWREVVPNSPNFNDLMIFNPSEAVFLKRIQASPFHRIPLPWSP